MIPRLYHLFNAFDETTELGPDEAHYLRAVLRKSVGDKVRVFNGETGEYEASIAYLDKKKCSLSLAECAREAAPEPKIRLIFTPLKHDAMAFVLEKGTELGVTEFCLMKTNRTQNYKFHPEKMMLQLKQAVQQCERLHLPTLSPIQPFEMAIQPRSADEALFAAIERHQGKTLLDPENNISVASVALIVGPEGGFTDAEIALMKASPTITPITLGANVLRAETAILAGLSCFSMRNQKRAY